jgi:hypothetical protein
MKTTLEALLRARLADSRAMVGSLDINHDRVLLHFGAIGDLPRVTLSINDNEISIAVPDVLAVEWRLDDEAKRSRTPLDPAVPLTAVFDGDKLTAGNGGPEIILPAGDVQAPAAGEFVSFPKSEPIPSTFDGERLLVANGDPELVDPEKHNRDALVAMAKAEGVELGKDDTKRVIATKISEKRAAA